MSLQLFVSSREVFGQHSRLAYYRNEVRVTCPSRDDMQVKVIGNASARAAAQIHAYIKPVGMILNVERGLRAFGERHHLRRRRFVNGSERRGVLVRDDHQMA